MLSFLILLFTLPAGAESQITFSYEKPAAYSVSPSQWLEWRQRFEAEGLVGLAGSWQLNRMGLHQMAMSVSGDRFVLQRWGLKVRGKVPAKVKLASGLLVHLKQPDGTYMAMLFSGFSDSQIQKILRGHAEGSTVAKLWNIILPAAAADTCTHNDPRGNLAAVVPVVREESLLRTIGSCAWSGINAAGESAMGVMDFFKTLYNDPAQVWANASGQFQQVKKFVLEIRQEFNAFIEGVKGLDWRVVQELLCQMVGQSVTALLAGAGVAGMGKAVLLFQQAISKIGSVKSALRAVSKLSEAGQLKGEQLRLAVSRLLGGDRELVQSANTLAERGLPQTARSALMCGVN